MPLNKVKPGSNMYQWVTHTHNHLAGACPHACTYCSTQDLARRFPAMAERYSGEQRLLSMEFGVDYNKRWRPTPDSEWRTEKTIFMGNCSDLFAEGIPYTFILLILAHANRFPENIYAFQTKNPGRIGEFLNLFPPHFLIGTTAESNRMYTDNAPRPSARLRDIEQIPCDPSRKFITIEPVMQFDFTFFYDFLLATGIKQIYIGADSKNHGLPEPTGEEIGALVRALRKAGKTVMLKSNLSRLYKGE